MTYTIEEYRLLANLLLVYACGATGRSESDPVYKRVTEDRDTGAAYSSCADLAHWLHYRLGLRGSWINRKEHMGWRVGQNVSKLAFSSVADPHVSGPYSCGDIGVIWSNVQGTDAHVLVVRHESWSQSADGSRRTLLDTAEYGQPGGALRVRSLLDGKIGTRTLQRVLRLAECIDTCAGSGRLMRPDADTLRLALEYGADYFTGEVLDACEKLLARPWTA